MALLGCSGAPKELPPRTPPPRIAPAVGIPADPPAPGQARVVLGTTDGPMRVEARGDLDFAPAGTSRPPSRFGELCMTPCVVDLPPGKYKLYLTAPDRSSNAGDVDVIDIREGVNYYVRAPGKFEPPEWIHIWPSVLTLAGLIAISAGAVYVNDKNSGAQTAGIALLAGGVAVTTVGGILIYDASRGATQEGASTTWWESTSSP